MKLSQLKPWIAAIAGAAFSLAAVAAWDVGRYVSVSAPPSSNAVERPLLPFTVDPSWVKSGTPNFRAIETARSPDGRSITGLWECDGPTTFEWTFGLDETVHLLAGRVEVEYLGRRFVLEPGHTAVFQAGTKAVWHVPQHAKKVYKLYHPGPLGLMWRKLFPADAGTPA